MLLDCNPVLDEIYSGDLSLFAAIGIKFIQIIQSSNLLGPVHTNLNIFESAFFFVPVWTGH